MVFFNRYKTVLALVFFAQFCIADDSLYDPVAPDGSAFIRVFQGKSLKGPVIVGGKKLNVPGRQGLSHYIYLPAGSHQVKGIPGLNSVNLTEKAFYTLLVSSSSGKGGRLVKDQSLQTKTKALIQFYNLDTKRTVSLKTSNGKVTVIDSLQPGQVGFRQINAVKVPLALFADNKLLERLGNVQLERGKVFNVIYRSGIREPLVLTQASRVNTRM